jgi:hypothetical protein
MHAFYNYQVLSYFELVVTSKFVFVCCMFLEIQFFYQTSHSRARLASHDDLLLLFTLILLPILFIDC